MIYITRSTGISFSTRCADWKGNFVEEDHPGSRTFRCGKGQFIADGQYRYHAKKAETMARRIDLYCDTGSPAFTAKWVPRMPMVAVGVSKRAFSGASFPMRPER
jgi:hypothetical protein